MVVDAAVLAAAGGAVAVLAVLGVLLSWLLRSPRRARSGSPSRSDETSGGSGAAGGARTVDMATPAVVGDGGGDEGCDEDDDGGERIKRNDREKAALSETANWPAGRGR